MKMKVGTRIIFSILMLVIIAICVLIFMAAIGYISPIYIEMLYAGFMVGGYAFVWAIASGIIALICLCLLFFGIKKDRPKTIVIVNGDNGAVDIAIEAFTELIARYLDTKTMIVSQKISVKTIAEREVKIKLELSAKPETNIPQAAEEVKTGLKEYLDIYTGVNASSIAITVNPYRQQNVK